MSRKLGDFSMKSAGNASVALLGGGLGLLAAALVYATAEPTRVSFFIRAGVNVGLGLVGGMLIPGSFGVGFAAGLGGSGAVGIIAAATAPDRIPAFRGLAKSLSSATSGGVGAHKNNRGYGKTLAGTMLGSH